MKKVLIRKGKMVKIYMFYFLFFSAPLLSMIPDITPPVQRKDKVHIMISATHHLNAEEQLAEKMLAYMFGKHTNHLVTEAVSDHLRKSHGDPVIKELVSYLDTSSSSEAPTELKKLIIEAVSEEIELYKQSTLAQAQELALKEKQLKNQKYKFYAALATAGTSLCGMIATILAYTVE